MNRDVVISGYGSCILPDENDQVTLNRNNRRIMRFARKSGRMFLQSLRDAMEMADCESMITPQERKGVFYGDFLNLVPDREHREEIFTECKNQKDSFDKGIFFQYVTENWSAVEVLKDVPNIPCFLAAKMTESTGESETILASCASGLIALKNAWQAVAAGHIDVAFVGAGSAKNDPIEKKLFSEQGFFNEDDYSIADGGASLVLETAENLRKRGANQLAVIKNIRSNFSPETYIEKRYDKQSAKKLMSSFENADTYITGSFSKKLCEEEKKTVESIYRDLDISQGFKEKNGYTFAASGLIEIIRLLEKGNRNQNCLISSMGYGGHNALAQIVIK